MGKGKPVRFALVETATSKEATTKPATTAPSQPVESLELILSSGDRLRIPADAATLRLVLSVLQSKSLA